MDILCYIPYKLLDNNLRITSHDFFHVYKIQRILKVVFFIKILNKICDNAILKLSFFTQFYKKSQNFVLIYNTIHLKNTFILIMNTF